MNQREIGQRGIISRKWYKTEEGAKTDKEVDALVLEHFRQGLTHAKSAELITEKIGYREMRLEGVSYGAWTISSKRISDRLKRLRNGSHATIAMPLITASEEPHLENQWDSWSDTLREELQIMDYTDVEKVACEILKAAFGCENVEHTGKSGDGGIDGIGYIRKGESVVKVAMQCKRVKDSVRAEQIHSFLARLDEVQAPLGYFFSTSGFTPGAREAANYRVELIDGERMVSQAKKYGIVQPTGFQWKL